MSMPRPEHFTRQFLIYLPTEKDLENWKEQAKAAEISLNKYIYEMVERGRVEAQPRTDLIKEISDLREENQKQREEIKLKSLVIEKYETELFKLRHESFLQPKFQGVHHYNEDLVNLLRKGRVHSGPDILKSLNIDPKDGDAVKIVYKQLQILQDFKLIEEGVYGWKWVE
jgi:hypothetical protein